MLRCGEMLLFVYSTTLKISFGLCRTGKHMIVLIGNFRRAKVRLRGLDFDVHQRYLMRVSCISFKILGS